MVREHGNLKPHEICMITDTVLCRLEQMKKLRDKFSRMSWTVSICSQQSQKTPGCSEHSQLYHVAREHYTSATKEKQCKKTFSSDIRTIGIDRRSNLKVSPRRKSKSGAVLKKDQNENTSQRQCDLNIGKTHTTWSKPQQAEQAPLPPPSTQVCRKQQNGIQNMFSVSTRLCFYLFSVFTTRSEECGDNGMRLRETDCSMMNECLTISACNGDEHLNARMFFSAFMHCAFAAARGTHSGLSPQHQVRWSSVSLKSPWCAFRAVQRDTRFIMSPIWDSHADIDLRSVGW